MTFTYHFNSSGGRHADGTWWLSPNDGKSKVTITEITSNLTIKAEDNPGPAARGFIDNSENYGNFDASKNIIPSTHKAPWLLLTSAPARKYKPEGILNDD